MFSVLSACSGSADTQTGPTTTPASLFTATPELASTATALPELAIDIEYSSVAEALADLKTREDVSIHALQGWTIVTEANGLTNWSFAPSDHPAYPAVAKRVLYRDEAGWHFRMDVLCEAEPAACEEFVRYFETINAPMYQYIESHQ